MCIFFCGAVSFGFLLLLFLLSSFHYQYYYYYHYYSCFFRTHLLIFLFVFASWLFVPAMLYYCLVYIVSLCIAITVSGSGVVGTGLQALQENPENKVDHLHSILPERYWLR